MEIRYPNVKLIKEQQVEIAVEVIVKQLLTVNFWVGFVGWYQIWQWIKPYLGVAG